ncbi:TspO/MBR family protein [Sphingomonas sp. 1P06PA]|uniref:TspO/MBR family protein n=1 Tax=Sphingomonas sp. 1P06PA TaxID=554121 RepID=UPI0039A6C63C
MALTPFLVSGGAAIVLGVAGGLLTEVGAWYKALRKPRLNPPDWLFGPAWTLILGMAAASAGIAWQAAAGPADRNRVVILFLVNALCHLLWSPLFFKAKRPDWALVEVIFLWGSLVALLIGLWPISQTAALLILPYLVWVSFAAWLNWQIVKLNAPFGRG